jgi:hypothetical protein
VGGREVELRQDLSCNDQRDLAGTAVSIGGLRSEGRKDECKREWGGMKSRDNGDQLGGLNKASNSRLFRQQYIYNTFLF